MKCFQEAGATLGLLAVPKFQVFCLMSTPQSKQNYECFQAGLQNLSVIQYPEGCFDEWYKGEWYCSY